jgi:amino acid transporter
VDVGHALFVTSIVAAMISFHNTTARYMFALGRERVLPAWLGRTAARTGSPHNASLLQSAIGLTVIVAYAAGGWDPLVHLFYWAGTIGGLGVLFLITTTALAVISYFAKQPDGEAVWRRLIAPSLAAIALVAVAALAVWNVGTLLGVPPGHPLAWAVPTGYLVLAIAGIGWGLRLRNRRPDVYAAIGLGAKSASTTPPLPAPRHTPAYQASPARQIGAAQREVRR